MFSIIVSVLVGLALGGIIHLTLRALRIGGRTRKSLPVLAAGIGMISYNVYDEYSWFDRQTALLGPEMKVIMTFDETSMFRPWTSKWPYTHRFIAIDTSSIEENSKHSNLFSLVVTVQKRHESAYEQQMVVDCAQFRRADFAPIDPADLEWFEEDSDHPLMTAVCRGR